jgi:hypothetical protein
MVCIQYLSRKHSLPVRFFLLTFVAFLAHPVAGQFNQFYKWANNKDGSKVPYWRRDFVSRSDKYREAWAPKTQVVLVYSKRT